MKDLICLIPPEHIAGDKSYSNIAEFALDVGILKEYISVYGKGDLPLNCSDYDIFRRFITCVRENGDSSSRAYLYFDRMLELSLGISASDVISGDIDEVWSESAKRLLKRENTLRGIISRSAFDSVGIAISPWETADLPDKLGDTEIKRIVCPLGVRGKSVIDLGGFANLSELCDYVKGTGEDDCAVFMGELDFEFEKPNLYAASAAYERIVRGQTPKNSDLNILKTQLLRELMLFCAQQERGVMLVLPTAQNVKMMYQTEQLLGYLDEILELPLNITLFAPDAVGFSFALAVAGKTYKKITAEAAICGNDCHFISDNEIRYWGSGGSIEKRASLATTPAHLGALK